MRIPAGEHTIKFQFEPQIWALGNTTSLIGSILLLLFIAGGIYMYITKERVESSTSTSIPISIGEDSELLDVLSDEI